MTRTLTALAAGLIALAGAAGTAAAGPHGGGNGHDNGHDDRPGFAQDHERGRSGFDDNHHDNGRHEGWRKGGRIDRDDWSRGQRIDWRRHHLRQPPRGYEWRQVDNNYVLATAATGLIASIIAHNH